MRSPTIITGRMVLYGILMFFGVIVLVNGIFVYFAMDSWPGLSTENAYEEGKAYNKTIAIQEAQQALGWSSRVTLLKGDNERHLFRIDFRDEQDQPLSGLNVSTAFTRPVGDKNMIELSLTEVSDGLYEGSVALPLAGRWFATIKAGREGAARYVMQHEVSVDQ